MPGPQVIDHGAGEPVWLQLTAILRVQIQARQLSKGKLLPSIRTLMQTYEVSDGTVKRALAQLKADGLVDSVPGRGYFVL
jgi:DNA-binding GntR family transcriptional regulator